MVILDVNERTKSLWDVDEKCEFIKIMNYKVSTKIPGSNHYNVALLLHKIDLYINEIRLSYYEIMEKKGFISPQCKILYTTICNVQELPNKSGFHGLNKPKDVYCYTNPDKLFALDNDVRAGWRLIMLELRDSNGDFISWNDIHDTLLHELTHTMCNHIRYRDEGNHSSDFKKAEKELRKFVLKNPNSRMKSLIKEMKEIIKKAEKA